MVQLMKILPVALIGIGITALGMTAVRAEDTLDIALESLDLFDFKTQADVQSWRIVNDTVMGGVSRSRIDHAAPGLAIFSGTLSLENNGGFASARSPKFQHPMGDSEGLEIRVKGDGRDYNCNLRTKGGLNWVFYQAGFETQAGEWQVIRIPFSKFKPTFRGRKLGKKQALQVENIEATGFIIADKQAGEFRLEVDWIKAFR